jgi:type IV pilus assembly protein PilF
MMTKAKAGAARMRAAGLLAVALAGTWMTLLAGCAAPQRDPEASTEIVTPSEESPTRKRARIRLELAADYFGAGKTEVALDEVRQVLQLDPEFGQAWNLRGLIFMRLGDNRAAEESFRRAVSLNPRDADAHHNYGWLECQTGRYAPAIADFQKALANPIYAGRSKTLMAMGICQARAGQTAEAEKSLTHAYELDAGNPITGYNLAKLLYERGDYKRAEFYIRRINNSELANAESLWLGVKVEHRLNDTDAMNQLGEALRHRFPDSRQRAALDRKAFDE